MKQVVEFLDFLRASLPTVMMLCFVALFVYYLLRLHLSSQYENFDLAELVTKRDGSVDFEKLRVLTAYVLGAYGFVYLLIHDRPAFVTYGPWFLGLVLTHAVANRVTAKPEPPAQPAPPAGG